MSVWRAWLCRAVSECECAGWRLFLSVCFSWGLCCAVDDGRLSVVTRVGTGPLVEWSGRVM